MRWCSRYLRKGIIKIFNYPQIIREWIVPYYVNEIIKPTLLLIVSAAIGVIPRLFPRDPSAQPDSRRDVRLDTEERV